MRPAAEQPSRPAVRFHGSKRTAAPWIISLLPGTDYHDTYVETHAGGRNVLLHKERSLIEAANDLDGDVDNFFTMLRDRTDELIRAIDLTPFHYAEWRRSYETTDDPLERARRFYVRAFLSIAGPTSTGTNPGFRRQKKFSRGRNGNKTMVAAAKTFAETDHLWVIARRLKGVTFEQENALTLIGRYDLARTLFYVDPPYYPDTRVYAARTAYRYEMTHDDHAELLRVLNGLAGMVALSGYRCELYDDELREWTRHDRSYRVNGAGSRIESLWLNPAAAEALERGREAVRKTGRGKFSFLSDDIPAYPAGDE